jgi:hypothetical protein
MFQAEPARFARQQLYALTMAVLPSKAADPAFTTSALLLIP